MIICPTCESQSFIGAFFCIDCGVALVEIPGMATDSPKQAFGPSGPEKRVFDGSEFDALEEGASLGLRVMATGEVLSLHGRSNFTLGQSVDGQAVVPDVDLGPFDAEAHGISRIHAELRREGSSIMAIDLDSSNGTRVNGLYLDPQEPLRLHHGDMLQMGSLQLQLLIRNQI